MIITFCGHSTFHNTDEYEQKILSILEEKVADNYADMYLGGYGNFDSFAYLCCKKYQRTHPNVSLVFVTPYLTLEYQKRHLKSLNETYDCIVYPEIEGKPLKFAISYRNRWMIEKSTFVIAYVSEKRGGAYATYRYAKRLGKDIYNLYSAE